MEQTNSLETNRAHADTGAGSSEGSIETICPPCVPQSAHNKLCTHSMPTIDTSYRSPKIWVPRGQPRFHGTIATMRAHCLHKARRRRRGEPSRHKPKQQQIYNIKKRLPFHCLKKLYRYRWLRRSALQTSSIPWVTLRPPANLLSHFACIRKMQPQMYKKAHPVQLPNQAHTS